MTLLQRIANRSLDLLFLPPFSGFWRQRLKGKVLCLLYHRVDAPGRIPFLDRFGVPPITPADLREELRFLAGQGAVFLTFSDLRRGSFPAADEIGVIVCFDDGFHCNYTSGLGVLEWLQIRGVIFQSTAMVGADTLIWEHRLYWFGHEPGRCELLRQAAHRRLPASRPHRGDALVKHLRDAEPIAAVEALLQELVETSGCAERLSRYAADLYPDAAFLRAARTSHHEIASHGHHHYPRRGIDEQTFRTELIRSQEEIEAIVGRRPQAFSYPFNSHGPGDAEICAEHYRQVATVEARPILASTPFAEMPRCTWPGPFRNRLQRRRWLLTGHL